MKKLSKFAKSLESWCHVLYVIDRKLTILKACFFVKQRLVKKPHEELRFQTTRETEKTHVGEIIRQRFQVPYLFSLSEYS